MNYELVERGARFVDEIYPIIKNHSPMTYEESCFLSGVIDKYKPRKILELGVHLGDSTAVILHTVKNRPDVSVHSVDLSKGEYIGRTVTDHFMPIAARWKLHKGNMFVKIADEIGGGIDLVCLDTLHVLPGEVMDYLQVLPYLNPNAVLVLHDIMWHNILHADVSFYQSVQDAPIAYRPFSMACNGTLFAAIQAQNKFFFMRNDCPTDRLVVPRISNIGAMELGGNPLHGAFSVFYLLTLPWFWPVAAKCYSETTLLFLQEYFHRHYSAKEYEIYDSMLKWITENNIREVHKKSWSIIPGESYVLYGAADCGARMKSECEKRGAKVLFFCDSDGARHGREFQGIPILSPGELVSRRNEYSKIIVTSGSFQAIQATLEGLNFVFEKDFVMGFHKYSTPDWKTAYA